jgi:hypothetical protein
MESQIWHWKKKQRGLTRPQTQNLLDLAGVEFMERFLPIGKWQACTFCYKTMKQNAGARYATTSTCGCRGEKERDDLLQWAHKGSKFYKKECGIEAPILLERGLTWSSSTHLCTWGVCTRSGCSELNNRKLCPNVTYTIVINAVTARRLLQLFPLVCPLSFF